MAAGRPGKRERGLLLGVCVALRGETQELPGPEDDVSLRQGRMSCDAARCRQRRGLRVPLTSTFSPPGWGQEQIDSLVELVCGKAVKGRQNCNGVVPGKMAGKRGPRKRATVEVSRSRLPSSHLAKSATGS